MVNTYYKILNEIASVFDIDQWDNQVNTFTDVIDKQLNAFVHNTKYSDIFILEDNFSHKFPQFNFYKERCYINGEKVELDIWGTTENKWQAQETVNVIIKDLDQLGKSCEYMFYDCRSLVSVPWFDTTGVTDMYSMFNGCESLVSVPKFNTNRMTHMGRMFIGCDSLSEETKKAWSSVYDFKTNIQIFNAE